MALNVLIIPVPSGGAQADRYRHRIELAMPQVLAPDDQWVIGDALSVGNGTDWDLIVAWEPVGASDAAKPAAESKIPCLPLSLPLVFHPFSAAFNREVERRGGLLLPASDLQAVTTSLDAVRAAKLIAHTRLLVVDGNEGNARADQIRQFAQACRTHYRVEIEPHCTAELLSRAAQQSEAAVTAEWSRWLDEVLIDAGEMSAEHMRQVVRLYLAERQMLDEYGAQGITVDDIGSFFLRPERLIMPNCTYAPLTMDGYLCCEEGDIEALATELILRAGLGAHPTMSNIYLAYRNALDGLETDQPYTPELERLDYLQCVADNHVVASHFSTSGVLPPNMMEETRYRVRETLPAWVGQSMTQSTPKLGPVVLARLSDDASQIHLLSGEVDQLRIDDRRGWYRGRWMIRIPSVNRFVTHCLNQHYAIGPENNRSAVLDTLTQHIFRLDRVDAASF